MFLLLLQNQLSNTIQIYGNDPTLKCTGKTKFCDNHIDLSRHIVNEDLKTYNGSTNCKQRRFLTGCR